jgi:hypothetical protein
VNGSQLKFLEGTQLMSQNGPNTPLFQLRQDYITIEKLLVLETSLETLNQSGNTTIRKQIEKPKHEPSRPHFLPLKHFIEHIAGVLEKHLREYKKNEKNSSLLIWWLKDKIGTREAIRTQHKFLPWQFPPKAQSECKTLQQEK